MHARCNAVQFNWAEAGNEEKESGIALIGRAARDYVINTATGREREGEGCRRVLFGAPAANWSNFASQTIVYRPRGGLTRVLHPARVKESVTRDFMEGDHSNYVAQTARALALCIAKKSRAPLLQLDVNLQQNL